MKYRVEVGDDHVPFVQLGNYTLRLDLEELDGEFKERARNEFRETPEVVKQAIKQFKKYIAEEPNLYLPVDDTKFLTKYLRPFKFCPKTTFKVVRKYYKFKIKHPELQSIKPSDVSHVFENGVFTFLPTRTNTGSRILLLNLGANWNPKVVTFLDMFKAVVATVEIAMLEPKTHIAGAQVIVNLEGFSFSHLYELSPSNAKMILDFAQECTPAQLMGVHTINHSFLFNVTYAIFKPFIGEKLRKLLFFHAQSKKSLYAKIPREALPESLGGNVPEYPGKLMAEMLHHYETTFAEHSTHGYKS